MVTRIQIGLMLVLLSFCAANLTAQKSKNKSADKTAASEKPKTGFDTVSLSGLHFRSLGPAITSGRVVDFAVDPSNTKRYFVASAAGGVWRTTNAGTTFEPVFDSQGSYSIGTVVIDPTNPDVIWVGSGENNNQRSVSYGDGIYKSSDGGNTWKNMGLKTSEHIAKIVIHPGDPDIVFVAAQGPLWSAGGERGVYRTKDGGTTWEQVLTIDENTGVADLVMDPKNPDVLYASAHQRRRHVFTYLGGGPQSTLYKSTDGGTTWNKSASGLPSGDLGRIGLAISPADGETLYAIVEASGDKGGIYRSTNRGASWEKRSGYNTAGNYYTELIPDPKDKDKLYSMDTWMKVSTDGGKSWSNVGEDMKHVDNHALWIDPNDTGHLLDGCDGGVYETWDAGKTWSFKSNLPVTQFYKVALDNAEPFYNIYGGTQDNFSLGGPSRSMSGNGIANSEWFITHGGDGFESQIDPNDPNIVYAQSQYGGLSRYDRLTGEEVGIQPHERKGENAYRWNWDAPLAVSKHVKGRIYFAANKLFVSDDRGDNWIVISDDLTRQIDRNKLKVMGRVWSMDAVAKNQSTSPYGNIVAFDESPLDENLLVIGTDDGLIQITSDRGKSWRKIDGIAGAPDTSYVNMVVASSHDKNTIYACFNHHKYGDFKPYVFVSHDLGNTWQSISNNLPERGSVYCLAEDTVDGSLLFAGTEFGCYFTNSGGKSWRKLDAGLPTIAVRDMAIQSRENDLVLATFGRGFYVLDDYSCLRHIGEQDLSKQAYIMPVRDADLFEYRYPLGLPKKAFQGDSYYQGENLGSAALISFYVKDKFTSSEDARKKEEEKLAKDGKDNSYPTYEELVKERDETGPVRYLVIRDKAGNIVRKLEQSSGEQGLQRAMWDLRTFDKEPASEGGGGFYNPFAGHDEGYLVAPGEYKATLEVYQNGMSTAISNEVMFNVVPIVTPSVPVKDMEAVRTFKEEATELNRVVQTTSNALGETKQELGLMRIAIGKMEVSPDTWLNRITALDRKVEDLQRQLSGDPLKTQLDMDPTPSISDRINRVLGENKYSSSSPTGTHKMSLGIAKDELKNIVSATQLLLQQDMPALRADLQKAGAPYTPNAIPSMKGM